MRAVVFLRRVLPPLNPLIRFAGLLLTAWPVCTLAQVTVAPPLVDFGAQSMGTTSAVQTVTLTNASPATVTIGAVVSSDLQFGLTNGCSVLAPGAQCTIALRFSPLPKPVALNAAVTVPATISIQIAATPTLTLPVSGSAEKSLVTHYYRSILRREPDGPGKQFWQDEASRLAQQGINVNEAWFAMAMSFYFSPEYAAFGRNDTDFVTDLYNTFFNRAPDGAGLAFWTGQLASGLPREVALAAYMFSTEFANLTQTIFGNTAARSEVNVVVDFYRGLLSRLPDTSGFNFWVQQFRTAQCRSGAAVNSQAEAISSAYANSAEYAARARTNAQYVGDLYNAFLRRGGDLAGVQFWINQIATGAQTREAVRQQFVASAEFAARVNSIVGQGCAGRYVLSTRGIFAFFDRRGWPNGYYSGDTVKMLDQHDDQLAGVIGSANVAATVRDEIGAQLEQMRAMGANTITFELRATDAFYDPTLQGPPVCNVPPSLGLLYPQPTAIELTNLRAFFDLAQQHGFRVLLVLNNTHMEEQPPTNNAAWLGAILDVVKDHPALDAVFFGGDQHVLSPGGCGIPAEPALWLGVSGYAAQYVKWAIALGHQRGLPYSKLSAEAIVGNYYVDRVLTPTVTALAQVFDQLGVPANQRTFGLSIYSHRRCANPNDIQLACTDADPDAWAEETLAAMDPMIAAGSRFVAVEYGDYVLGLTLVQMAAWDHNRAVESLAARMSKHGVDGGAYWIWVEDDRATDTGGLFAGEPVRRRGLVDVFDPVRQELTDAYGYHLGAIQNGSFEAGATAADHWTVSLAGTAQRFRLADEAGQPVIASRGSYAMRLTTGAGLTDAVAITSDALPVAPAVAYTTTANLRFSWTGDGRTGSDPSRPNIYVMVSYLTADGSPSSFKPSDTFRFYQEDGLAAFGTYPVQYTTPPDTQAITIQIGAMRNGLTQPIVVDVDNVR